MIGNDFDFQNQCFVVILIFKITKMGRFCPTLDSVNYLPACNYWYLSRSNYSLSQDTILVKLTKISFYLNSISHSLTILSGCIWLLSPYFLLLSFLPLSTISLYPTIISVPLSTISVPLSTIYVPLSTIYVLILIRNVFCGKNCCCCSELNLSLQN